MTHIDKLKYEKLTTKELDLISGGNFWDDVKNFFTNTWEDIKTNINKLDSDIRNKKRPGQVLA